MSWAHPGPSECGAAAAHAPLGSDHVERAPTGGFLAASRQRASLSGNPPKAANDRFWQTSADGLFILQLQAALTQRGLANYRGPLKERTAVFVRAGGIFGSINHDTYDPQESVAYPVAFRTLLAVSRMLKDDAIRTFAYEKCLAGLDQFKMREDRNGVATVAAMDGKVVGHGVSVGERRGCDGIF